MLVFGLVGYVFKKLDYPIAPLVLAMVLGDKAEDAFRQSMIMSQRLARDLLVERARHHPDRRGADPGLLAGAEPVVGRFVRGKPSSAAV